MAGSTTAKVCEPRKDFRLEMVNGTRPWIFFSVEFENL